MIRLECTEIRINNLQFTHVYVQGFFFCVHELIILLTPPTTLYGTVAWNARHTYVCKHRHIKNKPLQLYFE